jgi:hypothetical protein
MIALHHWRDNTVSALDALHVCTSVVRHAKSAGDSNKRNGSSATQPPSKSTRTTATNHRQQNHGACAKSAPS